MFRRHWTKVLLALTGFFWTGCEDSSSEAVCLYGPDPSGTFGPPSEDLSSESGTVKSSSSKQKSVSSSSRGDEPRGIAACYDVSSDRQTLVRQQNNGTTLLSCDDGAACQEKVVEADVTAPDCEVTDCDSWEPPIVRDTVYYCINGENSEVYTPEEFMKRYAKVDKNAESSSSSLDMPIAVYGPPCYFSGTCDTEDE